VISVEIVNPKEVLDLKVKKRGRITVPSKIRDKYNIKEGVVLKIGVLEITRPMEMGSPADKMYEQLMDEFEEKLDLFLEQEKELHGETKKAYRHAYERLQEEFVTDE